MQAIVLTLVGNLDDGVAGSEPVAQELTGAPRPWLLCRPFDAEPSDFKDEVPGANSVIDLGEKELRHLVAETIDEIANLCDARRIHREPG